VSRDQDISESGGSLFESGAEHWGHHVGVDRGGVCKRHEDPKVGEGNCQN
jgi:hypothetical protein